MKTQTVLSRSFILATVMLLVGVSGLADTIRLKNGSIIKGKVVTYNQQEFTIMLDLGTSSRRSTSRMVIAAEDIESIEFDASDAGGPTAAGSVPSNTEFGAKRGGLPRETEPPSQPVETSVPDRTPARDTITVTPPDRPTNTEPPSVVPTSSAEPMAVIAEKTVSVSSSADWTSTEVRVQRGQRISISASGEVDLGNNKRSGPDGISLSDSRKLIPTRPTGALIAVVGDDNDDFVYIGRSAEFTATHNGILFLSVNEGNLKDNSGSFLARVKVMGSK